MRHIRKTGTLYETEGIKATQEYMDSNWVADEERYQNLSYSKSRMADLKKVLYDEQKDTAGNCFCCYCMRRLFSEIPKRENVTLEHIVPHKIKEHEWEHDKDKYLRYPNLQGDKIMICYGGKLSPEQTVTKITRTPFPHYVSYHNLVVSCDGKIYDGDTAKKSCCCNNKRGEKFVDPIYLSQESCDNVKYTSDGFFIYEEPDSDEKWAGADCLALNMDWLVLVRKMWKQLADSEYTAEDVEAAYNDIELRQNIIDDIDGEQKIGAWNDKNDIWKLFSEYMWFYNYYRTPEKDKATTATVSTCA